MRLLHGLLVCVALSTSAQAHEFWIDPAQPSPAPGETLAAQIRVGQDMQGDTLSYLPKTIAAMRHYPPNGPAQDIEARIGDLPAIDDLVVESEGLHLLTVETKPAYIVFDDMPSFTDYLTYEGWSGIARDHLARNLPEIEIAEEYLRYARALVQVGQPQPDQRDRSAGLDLELVIDGSPFLPDQTSVPVRLTFRGEPLAERQVSVFRRSSEGNVERTISLTDMSGRIALDLTGGDDYLLNAVEIDPASGPGSVVWRSHWATLTFTLP